jgi:hypothetical protein
LASTTHFGEIIYGVGTILSGDHNLVGVTISDGITLGDGITALITLRSEMVTDKVLTTEVLTILEIML